MHHSTSRGAVAVCAAILFLIIRPVITTGQVLDVPEVIQEQTQWCWAATSCCVLNYYGNPVTQCIIADFTRANATFHNFGSVSCCEDPKTKCNYWNYNFGYEGSIEEILKEWGVANRGTGRTLNIEKIRTEFGAGRPFIIRWATNSGGHFIVGHGLVDSTFYYMDPWRGEGCKIADLKWVVANNSHTWEGTNVISTNPSVSGTITLLSPGNKSSGQPRTLSCTWRSLAGAKSYRFQCATAASFAAPVKDTTIAADTTLRLAGLSPSTVYYWRVRTANATDTGAWSETWSFTTEPSTAVAATGDASTGLCGRLAKNALSITYTVPVASYVNVAIHSLRGGLLRSVRGGFRQAGRHSESIAGMNLPSGNYVLSLCAGNFRAAAVIVCDGGKHRASNFERHAVK